MQSYMPKTVDGVNAMLVSFDTNINKNSGALATKYKLDAGQLARITQARLVWGWFIAALVAVREWAKSMTEMRDTMSHGPGVHPHRSAGRS